MKKSWSISISLALLFILLSACVDPAGQSLADLQIAAPGNFTALPNAGEGTITLTWTASSQASSYQLLRSLSDGGYAPLTETPNLTYSDTGLLPDTAYWYLLVARDTADGRSAGVKAVMTLAGFPAPTGLGASDRTGSSIRLTWNKLPGAAGYRLYRAGDGTTFTEIATPVTEEYVDSGLNSQTNFWYQVSAYNASVEGAKSAVLATATVTGGIAPPTGLSITNTSTTSIELTWDIMSGVDGYRIYRSMDGTNFTRVSTNYIGNPTTTYTDTGLQPETNYWYKVASYNWTDSGEVEGLSAALATSTLAAFKAVKVAAGSSRSFAVKSDGTVWGWGYNSEGYLGDGTTENRLVPVQIPGLSGAAVADGHHDHTVVLLSNKTLLSWGYNGAGQVGDGTNTTRLTPVAVSGHSDVEEISAGWSHTLARKSDGTLWGWGWNWQGQLGDGTTNDRNVPGQISSWSNVVSIAAGSYFSAAALSDGTVRTWGLNESGQLGDGTTTNRLTPVTVSGLSGVVKISAYGSHVLALKSDGTVWAWGQNSFGQVGDGTFSNRPSPVQVPGMTGVTAISAAENHSVTLKSDGTVWAWGNSSLLGPNTGTDGRTPVQVTGLPEITAISAGGSYTFAVQGNGTVWGWGNNWSGQLGTGTLDQRYIPTAVTAP